MTVLYKILSFIIGFIGIFIVIALLIMLPLALTAPALWLPTFMVAAVVLYTWFSGRFRRQVLQRGGVVPNSLRDWIRVNGFVSIAFCIINISTTAAALLNPARITESMKELTTQLGGKYEQSFRPENITTISGIMLIYLVALFVHILWTFALLKKYQENFK